MRWLASSGSAETRFTGGSGRVISIPNAELAAAARVARTRLVTAISAPTAVNLDRIAKLRFADFCNQVSLVFVAVLLQNPEQLARNAKGGQR